MADERHSTASQPPPRPRSESEAFDRLQALEVRVLVYEERTTERLNHGASAMAEFRGALGELRPKRQTLIPWAAVAIAVGGIVFRAGNYPDRMELEAVREASTAPLAEVRSELRSLERELIRVRTELDALAKRTDELLERARAAARGP